MIVKEVSKSTNLRMLDMFLRRLSHQHLRRKDLEDEWSRANAGHYGEKSVDYYLELLSNQNLFIFHDIRIQQGTHHFQMDILILSPYFFLMIEVKNMVGTLIFDQEFHQLIRIYKNKKEIFPCPISQIYRQKFLFIEWLKRHRLSSIPMETLVVISNPKTLIRATPQNNDVSNFVIHSNHLLSRFHSLSQKYKEEKASIKELKRITKFLLKHHTPSLYNFQQKYDISEPDIIKGVFCPSCTSRPMTRNKHKWLCTVCHTFSRTAHIQALKDYANLIGPTITNRQCCDFLQIHSPHVAQYILKTLNLPIVGTNKGRKYELVFTDSVL